MREPSPPSSPSLSAGSAKVDITPCLGAQLSGDIGRHRPAEWVADPLFARALALSDGHKTICLIALDLTSLTRPWADEIKRRLQEAPGLAPDAVMIHALQPHSAPCLGHGMVRPGFSLLPPGYDWLCGGDDDYHPRAVEGAVEAARQAVQRLAPVRVGYASGIEGRVAFNRRFVMRDGRVLTHPGQANPRVRHVEGPVDPELGVICFQAEDLSTVGMLLNYTCHPTHGYPQRWVSADWPGVWAAEMDRLCRPRAAALVSNGWCGNIHHTNHLDPQWKDDFRRMGGVLADTTRNVLQRGLAFVDRPVLDYRCVSLCLPKRRLPEAEQAAARALLAAHPEPLWMDEQQEAMRWDWVYALSRLDYLEEQAQEPDYGLPVQVFRIGEIALVGVPGEPFVEGQLRLKLESPTYPTFTLHMVHDSAGYIPTPQAFRNGGYETETSRWSFLGPEALDQVVDASLAVLRDLFA